MKIAIQGQQASFHDIAARKFFGNDISIEPCESFALAFTALQDEKSDFALVAIENSLYGTINQVYDLLLKTSLKICGEIYLPIEQCLVGLPGTMLQSIQEVHSHPVALAQCSVFLDEKLPNAERFEHQDTAASIASIKEWNDPTKAAIGSKLAAELYEMQVLAENIETNRQNYTRFVALQRDNNPYGAPDTNKTSLVLQTPKDTKAGSLFHALSVFASRGINLTALHSRPIVGKAWHYMFYIDIEVSAKDPQYQEILAELDKQGCQITILGNYKNGLL